MECVHRSIPANRREGGRRERRTSDNVQNLEIQGVMKPTVMEENLGREGSGNIKKILHFICLLF